MGAGPGGRIHTFISGSTLDPLSIHCLAMNTKKEGGTKEQGTLVAEVAPLQLRGCQLRATRLMKTPLWASVLFYNNSNNNNHNNHDNDGP